MTASRLELIPFLCLFCIALSSQEKNAVVWTRVGGAFTIQCRHPEQDLKSLTLKRGINTSDVLNMDSKGQITKQAFNNRLQINGVFPNLDILIENLTSLDTAPYWCFYLRFDKELREFQNEEGAGSVLLVVSGDPDTVRECTPSIKDPVLVSIVIAGVVLFGILISLLIWVIKIKTSCSTEKPRRVTTNDVYEDMRGTLRR